MPAWLIPYAPLLRRLALSLAAGYILGGFVAGVFLCEDCGGNPLGYALVGTVMALLSMLFLGFPPRNEGSAGPPYDFWPYILVCAAACFLLLTLYQRQRQKRA